MANGYLKSRGTSLEEAFRDKFGEELPEVINESHRILIVAPELDVIVEKVINYLSKYGININAILFNYYKIKDEEYIAKITLIPESITEERRTPSKRLREILWTEDLLKERLERLEDSALKARLEDLLEFSIKNNIFYKLYRSPTSPAFGIASKDNGRLKLSVSFNGSIHAYIGKKSLSRYSSEDSWKNFVEDLKELGLLPRDFIKNIDKRESTDLSKKLDQLSDEEYLQFKKILEKHLRGI
ncbi:MAG: hypothetical protein F7C36_01095 [Desulfurococcales archaeon]|nr:hypothetical protein [Desulfurococcales archaeon]